MSVSTQSEEGYWTLWFHNMQSCCCLSEIDRTAPLARPRGLSTIGQRTRLCTRPSWACLTMAFDACFEAAARAVKKHVVYRSQNSSRLKTRCRYPSICTITYSIENKQLRSHPFRRSVFLRWWCNIICSSPWSCGHIWYFESSVRWLNQFLQTVTPCWFHSARPVLPITRSWTSVHRKLFRGKVSSSPS